jgi:hypothetical protein
LLIQFRVCAVLLIGVTPSLTEVQDGQFVRPT